MGIDHRHFDIVMAKKELNLDRSLSQILQIIGITLLKKSPVFQVLTASYDKIIEEASGNQLTLFDS